MTLVNTLKVLHILSAMTWVGGGIVFQMLTLRAGKSGDPLEGARIGQATEWASTRVFMPASIATLVFGVLLVLKSPVIDFSDSFIQMGLTGVVVTLGLGMGVITPAAKKRARVIAERGPMDPQAQSLLKRMMVFARLNLLILVFMVFEMVVQP